MEFDRYTIALLLSGPDAPELDEAADAALQDAHMAYLADLQASGELLAAGPVPGPADRELRGVSILNVDPERARVIKEGDPAVRAGKFRVATFPWIMPAGLISFSPRPLPRSMAEASGE
jgi:uncharacterized protein YciI